MVSPGTPIVSLQTVSPIYAEFQLPQQALAAVKLGQKVTLKVDVFPDSSWEGTVTTINPEVDPGTRNVRMRATVENPDGRLNPGMFASVEVEAGNPGKALVVPATSVIYAPYGDSVYLVEEKKDEPSARPRPARRPLPRRRTHPRRHPMASPSSSRASSSFASASAAVTSSRSSTDLNGGETVVSNGAFKLRNGQTLMVNNSLAPPANFVPVPVDR